MRIVMFYHTLVSDWNHGNAHFLRGIASDLMARGHDVVVYEPADSWSYQSLVAEHGQKPVRKFHSIYPRLESIRYQLRDFDPGAALDGADLVIVHEWNDRELVRRIGEDRKRAGAYRLLFHDTHHRMVTDQQSMAAYDLSNFDGVLAYGRVLQRLYEEQGRARRVWTWHEAADTKVFRPIESARHEGDLVWIGNWGDNERSAELSEFLIDPIRELRLKARIHGVRYPEEAQRALAEAGIHYAGWLPNFEAPEVFARYKVTVHVPRRPYVQALPGIPTIRVFEALACGIPLVCSRWEDAEGLFRPGTDYLVAQNGKEMKQRLREVLNDEPLRNSLIRNGVETIRARHTCAHRVEELLGIYNQLNKGDG
jgi:spore maturation protein CgeB